MAQPYVTGPVDVWVAWGTSPTTGGSLETPSFLGHGIEAPSINIQPVYKDIYCDLTGGVPFDKMWTGEIAVVSVSFVRYNEAVMARLQSRASNALSPIGVSPRGTDIPGRMGTLEVFEDSCPFLFLRFPYAAKVAYNNATNGAIPAGYRFLNAILDPDGCTTGAADSMNRRLSWKCIPSINLTGGVGVGQAGTKLYDHDMSALPALYN